MRYELSEAYLSFAFDLQNSTDDSPLRPHWPLTSSSNPPPPPPPSTTYTQIPKMVPETLPPNRTISSRPISLATASTLLSTYLTHSETHPHLHPDALITPAGVTFSANGGPMGGVIMHNLRRVAAGLRGEYLEPEATPEPEEQQHSSEWKERVKQKAGKRKSGEGGEVDAGAGAEQEGWEDISEFEREEQGVEVGEIGPQDTFVQAGGEAPEVHATAGPDLANGAEVSKKRKNGDEGEKMDKAARKRAKKERNKEMRREKEKKRANKDKLSDLTTKHDITASRKSSRSQNWPGFFFSMPWPPTLSTQTKHLSGTF
ncbi:uncharacterized protein BDR25DRAFT_351197 [Lindgomyces ingoldianus]|uniref:Uncharacterized protein n=1 Tax=Lindgomyces ingoldianus TaxID=673940 RepID=A0ACB6R677_9PLEO|nr:uncharacterized protein BDR25DRAFT_351197 [Lindgomyces ingoldianus]KAF2474676.1 hypothetical protein BDR25DRAFT_351197 [Lindgomyces ingoldianus]